MVAPARLSGASFVTASSVEDRASVCLCLRMNVFSWFAVRKNHVREERHPARTRPSTRGRRGTTSEAPQRFLAAQESPTVVPTN